MTEGKRYITPAGRLIGVQEGLGGTWITAYQDRENYKSSGGGRPRVRFISVPTGETQEEAQQHLDEHAARLGYQVVE